MDELYRLVVEEEFVDELSYSIKNYCDAMDSNIFEYIKILKKLCSKAIVSGETADAISEFTGCAEEIKGIFASIGNCFEVTMDCFLDDIDSADKYLY